MIPTDEQLIRQLQGDDIRQRRFALAVIGRHKRYALLNCVMMTLLEDDHREVRTMAAWSLDLMGSVDSIPALIAAMYDEHFDVRSGAGWALVHIAQRYIPVVVLPEVIDVLRDVDSPAAQEMAYLVLSRINHAEARRAIELYWR